MKANDILFEDQKDFIFHCRKCKKEVLVEYGFEYGTQYAKIDIYSLTHPLCSMTRTRSFAYICKDCMDEIKNMIEFTF